MVEKNRESTLKFLTQLCQQKTVIIAVQECHFLNAEKLGQLGQFWQELVQRVQALSGRSPLADLLLLLTSDDPSRIDMNVCFPYQPSSPSRPISLEPLKDIPEKDISWWFKQSVDSKPLADLLGEEAVEQLLEQGFRQWPTEPSEVIKQICLAYKLDISEIEPYWRLDG